MSSRHVLAIALAALALTGCAGGAVMHAPVVSQTLLNESRQALASHQIAPSIDPRVRDYIPNLTPVPLRCHLPLEPALEFAVRPIAADNGNGLVERSSSARLLTRKNPLTRALVVCLVAFPGALIVALILNGSGTFDGLSTRGHATLDKFVSGVMAGGVFGLLYVALLGVWRGLKRAG